MDSAPTIEIPLPSEYPGRADPSPASRDPLNSLICSLLDPYRTIEEIAEDRRITVMALGEILSAEPASSTIESLRKVFALRAEMLALHARASAVGTLTRIANSGKDDEVARRAATTLLRMFRPDGTPASFPHGGRPSSPRASSEPSSPVTDGGGASSAPSGRGRGGHHSVRAHANRADRAPDRGSERSGSSSQPTSSFWGAGVPPASSASTPALSTSRRGCAASNEIAGSSHSLQPSTATSTSPSAARTPPAAPSEPRGAGGAASPSGSAPQLRQQPHQINHRRPEVERPSPSGEQRPNTHRPHSRHNIRGFDGRAPPARQHPHSGRPNP